MAKEVSKGLKLWFLISAIVGLIFTIIYLMFLEIYWIMVDWPYFDPIFGRILGATLLTMSVISLLAYRETEWENVKLIVIFSALWQILVVIINIWSIFAAPFSATALSSSIFDTTILIIFAIVNIYFYLQHQK